MAGRAVEAAAAGDQPQHRLAGAVPDAPDRQRLLGVALDPFDRERDRRSPVPPDHDPVALAELAQPEEHGRPLAGVDVAHDHRRAALSRPRAELVPAGEVDLRHLHGTVRPEADGDHAGVDADGRDGDGHRPRGPAHDPGRVAGRGLRGLRAHLPGGPLAGAEQQTGREQASRGNHRQHGRAGPLVGTGHGSPGVAVRVAGAGWRGRGGRGPAWPTAPRTAPAARGHRALPVDARRRLATRASSTATASGKATSGTAGPWDWSAPPSPVSTRSGVGIDWSPSPPPGGWGSGFSVGLARSSGGCGSGFSVGLARSSMGGSIGWGWSPGGIRSTGPWNVGAWAGPWVRVPVAGPASWVSPAGAWSARAAVAENTATATENPTATSSMRRLRARVMVTSSLETS